MSVTATTAPAPPKVNAFAVTSVQADGNGMSVSVAMTDANSNARGSIGIVMKNGPALSQIITYDANGNPQSSSLAITNGLTTAFGAFVGQAGAFAAKAAALETSLVSLGAIPS